MTIHELLALTGLTGSDEIPVWDAEASSEPTKKITAQNFAAAIKTLASLLGTGDVVNNLTSGGTAVPLSAEMGKQIRSTYNIVGSNVSIPNKSVANGTFETMATFTPDENGSYLIIANMGYGNDTNGIRILLVDTTETSSNTTSNSVLVVGRSMLQRVSIYALTTNDTVYIRAYQNSGGDLTVGGSYRVLRLK